MLRARFLLQDKKRQEKKAKEIIVFIFSFFFIYYSFLDRRSNHIIHWIWIFFCCEFICEVGFSFFRFFLYHHIYIGILVVLPAAGSM